MHIYGIRSYQLSHDVVNTYTSPSRKHPHLHPHYAAVLCDHKVAKLEVKGRHQLSIMHVQNKCKPQKTRLYSYHGNTEYYVYNTIYHNTIISGVKLVLCPACTHFLHGKMLESGHEASVKHYYSFTTNFFQLYTTQQMLALNIIYNVKQQASNL